MTRDNRSESFCVLRWKFSLCLNVVSLKGTRNVVSVFPDGKIENFDAVGELSFESLLSYATKERKTLEKTNRKKEELNMFGID
jgi:hypothetical protein